MNGQVVNRFKQDETDELCIQTFDMVANATLMSMVHMQQVILCRF